MDYYKILGVSPTASRQEIERAYRKLAFQYHPDRNPSKESHEKMATINIAFGTLRDPIKRSRYDEQLGLKRKTTPSAQPIKKYPTAQSFDDIFKDGRTIRNDTSPSIGDLLQGYFGSRVVARLVILLVILLILSSCITLGLTIYAY